MKRHNTQFFERISKKIKTNHFNARNAFDDISSIDFCDSEFPPDSADPFSAYVDFSDSEFSQDSIHFPSANVYLSDSDDLLNENIETIESDTEFSTFNIMEPGLN